MKLKIKNKSQIPYGGVWRYTDPNSHQEFTHYLYDGLVEKIRAHRIANNFPVGLGFEEEIESQLALTHSEEAEPFDPRVPRRKSLNLSDVIRGSQVMLSFYAAGKPLVLREEAERRAKICLSCVYNAGYSKPCSIGICRELREVVGSVINHVGTQYDKDLHVCHVCSCYNAAQIWIPYDILDKGLTDEMRVQFSLVEHCWKKPASS